MVEDSKPFFPLKAHPMKVHSDFQKRIDEIKLHYEKEHHMKVDNPFVTKIIADRITKEDVDIFMGDEFSRKKKLRKVSEIRSGFGFTPIMRK